MKHLNVKLMVLTMLMSMVGLRAMAYGAIVDGIKYNFNGAEAIVIYNPDYTGRVSIPPTVSYQGYEYSVTSIGDCAFKGCTSLTSITIPTSVTTIGKNAFEGCTSLTIISIPSPNNLTTIDDYAFEGCTSLTHISVPSLNSLISIGKHAFEGCISLTSINKLNCIRYNEYAFAGCTGLISLTIPNSVTSISSHVFEGCTGLTSLTIPNSVTGIGGYAFAGCMGLTSLTIPNSVTSMGDYVFQDCTGLTSVIVFCSPVTSKNIFNNCPNLKEVTFDCDRVSLLFYGVSSLLTVTMTEKVTSIAPYAFFGCNGLTSVTIPSSVTSIEKQAFQGCNGLLSVVIPNSVTTIGDGAFVFCNGLTSLTIGKNVINIGKRAFADDNNLTTIVSLIENPFTIISGATTNEGVFSLSALNGTLYVPEGTFNKYKNTRGWEDFRNIVEGTPSGINIVSVNKKENDTIYDLNGRLLKHSRKGINIIGGKKFLVK